MKLPHYLKKLREFFDNSKSEGTDLEKLFGSNFAVNGFSEFYRIHGDDLSLVTAYLLYNYSIRGGYTERDLHNYTEALTDFGEIFENCAIERQKKTEELTPGDDDS